jgi:hypothetical protein
VVSIAVTGAQSVLAIPRLWRNVGLAVAGLAVTLASLAISLASGVAVSASAPRVAATSSVGGSDAIAIVFELALLGLVAVLLVGRPRRLLERLRLKVMDAYVGTGLGVAAVAVFAIAGLLLGHAGH